MCARRFAPNAHASLRICLPAHTARTLYVVTPPDAPLPVGIPSVSACASGTVCRSPTLRSAYVFLHTRLGAVCSHASRRAAGGSISSPSQHVRLALCAERPRFASGDTLPTRRDSRGTSPMQAPSAPSLLRKTAPFLCPRQRSQFCPCVAARRSVLPPQNCSFLPPPAAVTVLPQNDR